MPRNGSGTYSLPAGNPVVTGTTVSSTVQNNTTADIAAALTASIAVDGQTPPTANLPMGGFKHTNVAAASALTDYVRADQEINSIFHWLTVSGVNAITATIAPPPAAYSAGQTFRFVAAGANTGAVTLNVNGLGAQPVTKFGAVALAANDILSGQVVTVVYDGTRFQLTNEIRPAFPVFGSPVATTSGNNIDLTGIPAGARRVVLTLSGVSTDGTNQPLIQLGTSGGVQTTGYATVSTSITTAANAATAYTNGWQIFSANAANVISGMVTFVLVNAASNTWSAFGLLNHSLPSVVMISGDVSLPAALDRIRLTTVGGLDAFDAGVVNVLVD